MTSDSKGSKLPSTETGDTWPKVLTHNFRIYGDRRVAVRYKYRGVWRDLTWKDYYLEVQSFALGLLAFGFSPGDRLLIIGDNAPLWYCAELAAQADHGAAIGVHPDAAPEEIKPIFERYAARFACVENQEQVDKLMEIKDGLPLLQNIVYWNYKGLSHYHDPVLIGYRELKAAGNGYAREHPDVFDQSVMSGKRDDICAIDAAGVVLSYAATQDQARRYLQVVPWLARDKALPSLPPIGAAEQCLGIGCHLLSACTLVCTESPETHRRDARELSPHLVFQPAHLWEKQAALVQARMSEADALKRWVFACAWRSDLAWRRAGRAGEHQASVRD